jgi:hypothetical protein
MPGLNYVQFMCNNFMDTVNLFFSSSLSVVNLPCNLMQTIIGNFKKIYDVLN